MGKKLLAALAVTVAVVSGYLTYEMVTAKTWADVSKEIKAEIMASAIAQGADQNQEILNEVKKLAECMGDLAVEVSQQMGCSPDKSLVGKDNILACDPQIPSSVGMLCVMFNGDIAEIKKNMTVQE